MVKQEEAWRLVQTLNSSRRHGRIQHLAVVILASAVGTMIEWYDFYIFGSLAAVLSPKFYPFRQRHNCVDCLLIRPSRLDS